MEFQGFPKIARLQREVIVTEKIDGTNGQIYIDESIFLVGSRSRWITPEDDNFGFARWAYEHKEELIAGLGNGQHFGEWWGSGIQRGYGLPKGEKRFSLFNAIRWAYHGAGLSRIPCGDPRIEKYQQHAPECCHIVPILYQGKFCTDRIDDCLIDLHKGGSIASPGFNRPEGIIIFHTASNIAFKKTIGNDGAKGAN